jgi:putative transcriptional regulator
MKNSMRAERAVLDITQEELARRVKVSRQTINTIEAGKYVPSTVIALKIARTFSKTVDEIFTLEESDWK